MIYPVNVKCYRGSITDEPTSFRVRIFTKDIRYQKQGFLSWDNALEHLRQKNIEFNLPIKNIIHEFDEHYEMELTQSKRMKFDKDMLHVVQQHVVHAHNRSHTYYAKTRINIRVVGLHNIIMQHAPGDLTVDHINHDGLDNRISNLRLATKRQQSANQRTQCNNTSGVKGVSKYKNSWCTQWNDEYGNGKSKWFSMHKYPDAKERAVEYRARMVSELEHYN